MINHFLAENVPRSTVFRLVKRWENGLPGSGRPAKIMTNSALKKLEKTINNSTGISTRMLGDKFKCDHSYIVKTINGKTDIRYHKRSTVPDRTEAHKSVLQSRCRRIFFKFSNSDFILDDESYFTFSHSDKNANVGFWSKDVKSTPYDVKFAKKKKLEKKLLVWVAISSRGISRPFIAPSGLAINQKVYLKRCIERGLIPFIKKYHSDGNYVFWPDLASSHYAKSVVQYFVDNNVHFVEKQDNPPCVPELRPIENFWSILKGLVYAKGWEAKSVEQLKSRIKYCLKKVDRELVQRMVTSVPNKIDRVRRYGIESI